MSLYIKTRHKEQDYLLKGRYDKTYSDLKNVLKGKDLEFFAEPRVSPTEIFWSGYFDVHYQNYTSASEDDKAEIADELDYLNTTVCEKLRATHFNNKVDDLLKVPDKKSVYYCRDASGLLHVTLIQWGCIPFSARKDFDPIGRILEEPRADRTLVKVLIAYTDGAKAANTPFWYFYEGKLHSEKETDENGVITLGHKRNGTDFVIANTDDRSDAEESFTVVAGQNLYDIVFPFYITANVKVIDQYDDAVAGCEINADYNNKETLYNTGDTGEFIIPKIVYNEQKTLTLTLASDKQQSGEYPLERENNEFVLKIKRRIVCNPHIKVVKRSNQEPVDGYPLKINVGGVETQLVSNSEGVVVMNQIELDTVFTVTDANDSYNHAEYTASRNNTEFVFPVEIVEMRRPVIKVVNRQTDAPLGAFPVKVKIGDSEQEEYTNREGLVVLGQTALNTRLLVTDANDALNTAEYTVDADHDEFIFRVDVITNSLPVVKIVDKATGNPVGAHPVKVKIGDVEQELYSNREGLILLDEVKRNTVITVTDVADPYNNKEYQMTEGGNVELVFPVELASEKIVRINLLNINKEILPDYPIDVIINGQKYSKRTDEQGYVSFSASLFTHGKKVKVEIPLLDNEKK